MADRRLLTAQQQGSLYFANCTIGTPAQHFRFLIDTGSSDLWANSATSQLCTSAPNPNLGDIPCSVSGTYNANKSSTYKYINSEFSISYADTTGAMGDYVSDVLNIGGKTVNPIEFGVGYVSNSSEGVMGIGYPALEVAVQVDNGKSYANLPQAMANQGLIQSPAYSLWLDDLDAATGSILFGGVDTDKFHGTLQTLPIVQEQGQFVEMIVELSSISLVQKGANTSVLTQPTPVLLDSGSTLSYLPVSFSGQLYKALGVEFNEQDGPLCSCSLANQSITIDFIFSGQVISVPIAEMVLEGGGTGTGSSGQALDCVFGIVAQPAESEGGTPYTLGDTFIRSAYIVYDLGNNEISLAATNFGVSSSNVLAIGKGAGAVPSATGAAHPPTTTLNGTPVVGGATGSGINPTASSTASSSMGAMTTTVAGIATRGGVGTWTAVLVAALGFAL